MSPMIRCRGNGQPVHCRLAAKAKPPPPLRPAPPPRLHLAARPAAVPRSVESDAPGQVPADVRRGERLSPPATATGGRQEPGSSRAFSAGPLTIASQ